MQKLTSQLKQKYYDHSTHSPHILIAANVDFSTNNSVKACESQDKFHPKADK